MRELKEKEKEVKRKRKKGVYKVRKEGSRSRGNINGGSEGKKKRKYVGIQGRKGGK